MELTARLAAFAADLRYEALPADVRARARMSRLDGIAVMLGAVGFARRTSDRRLERYVYLASEGVNQLALPNLGMSHIKHLRPSDRQKSRLIHKFSPEAGYVTGQTINLDGGLSTGN
jgi:hypothetical protein